MTGRRLLARNTLLNLAGLGVPLVVALAATPPLIRALGVERFGVLTTAWAVIGYFSLFDLGIGRALTHLVAGRVGEGREAEVPPAVWTATVLLLALGAAGGLTVWLLAPWLVEDVFRISPALRGETAGAIRLLAVSLPLVTSTAGLRGVLEAYQRFGAVNAIRLPLGVLTFLGPLAVVPFSRSLVALVGVLVLARMAAWIAHAALSLSAVPALRHLARLDRDVVGALFRYGGWLTVANAASTVMVYMDRFVIGAVVSMAAVAYYVTPYELASRIALVPGALLGVLFPAFATRFAQDPAGAARLFDGAVRLVFVALLPVALALTALAPEGLRLWVGADFAGHATPVLRWITVGVFVNCLALVPATALQGIGRPDLTAKLNVVELPLYLVALWLLLRARGIEGAAMAWTLRAVVDAAVLGLLARRASLVDGASLRRTGALLAGAAPLFAAAALLPALEARTAVLLAGTAVLAGVAWRLLLSDGERALVRSRVRPARPLSGGG